MTARAAVGMHACGWPSCDTRVPDHLWGCKKHWFILPLEIRQQIATAFASQRQWGVNVYGPAPDRPLADACLRAAEWIREHLSEQARGGGRAVFCYEEPHHPVRPAHISVVENDDGGASVLVQGANTVASSQISIPAPMVNALIAGLAKIGAREPQMLEDDIPRRCRVDCYAPAEKAISDAIEAVERLGGGGELTDAVVLLDLAQEKVADHLEGLSDEV